MDVLAIDRTGEYRGLYHVLHGAISPVEGIGPDELRIGELMARLKDQPVQEVLLATNPNLAGDGTALYISSLLKTTGVKITRLARGLPTGTTIEYASGKILTDAITGRQRLE